MQLALVGRYYERIGDHAVNIGERVHYMITGWLPERTVEDAIDDVIEFERSRVPLRSRAPIRGRVAVAVGLRVTRLALLLDE